MARGASIEPYGCKEQQSVKKSFFSKVAISLFLFAHAYMNMKYHTLFMTIVVMKLQLRFSLILEERGSIVKSIANLKL